jgi:hypothetical protein
MQQAHGTFTVRVAPLSPASTAGIARYSLEKQLDGDIEATSQGEMMGIGDPKSGSAGYVAIEVVTGTVAGKRGSFALQHSSTMDGGVPAMDIKVVPGSGTGELKGIAGRFVIRIESGQHFYDFDYTLAD